MNYLVFIEINRRYLYGLNFIVINPLIQDKCLVKVQ